MSTLTDVKLDLLAINYIDNKPVFSPLLAYLLDDLEDDLTGSGITRISLPSISKSYTVQYGTPNPDFINILDGFHDPLLNYIVVAGAGDDTVVGGLGNDILLGGDGNDVLMGVLGSNILDGGAGTDQLYGVVAQSSLGPLAPNSTTNTHFDSNVLFGGDGNDIEVGIAGYVDTISAGNAINSVSYAVSDSQYLYGGCGNDSLYGLFILNNSPWTNIEGLVRVFTALSNYLDGGAGDDLLIGEVGTNLFVWTNMQATFVDNYGGNKLLGGGGNDVLIGGDQQFIEISTHVSGSYIRNFADNTLDSGSGNDLLIGNVQALSETITNSPNWLETHNLGNDKLIGGSGNDVLIGDVQNLQATSDSASAKVVINFGSDTLISGRGNDILVGDVQNIDPTTNAILHFTDDTFVFSLSSIGHDKILDMNAGGVFDTLKFTGVGGCSSGIAAVDSQISSFTNDGTGHLLVNFKNGASIDFSNIAFAGQDSIHDITPNIVVVA